MTSKSIPIKELAKGHCLAVENACRLVEDGEVLLNCKRPLTAINLFLLAYEEFSKAHIISQSVLFSEDDVEKWTWFWKAFRDHREKLRVLQYEFHWSNYQDKAEFDRRINLFKNRREDSLYVSLDPGTNEFQKAGAQIGDYDNFAELLHQYLLGVIVLFCPAGLPTPVDMEHVYIAQRKKFMK
jgi:AbiV family abortive infection protein